MKKSGAQETPRFLCPASTQVTLEQYQQVRQSLCHVNWHRCYTVRYICDDQGSLGSALRKLEWAKDTPRWVTTNTTSKKVLKGQLIVVVIVVGFGLLWEDWGVAAARQSQDGSQ